MDSEGLLHLLTDNLNQGINTHLGLVVQQFLNWEFQVGSALKLIEHGQIIYEAGSFWWIM